MIKIDYNNLYLTKDEKPWFPVMGEIHYSRYDKNHLEESLYKMKVGGIDVVSSYTIWIHHEEIEGEYDFTKNKDLRHFIWLCKKCSLYLILRIGPWCHGEVRNGGFPDWLLKKNFIPRTNDDGYFKEVEKFYKRIFQEAKGFLLKDGGPIIGVQIENEYGHCGGLNGSEGEDHMKALTKIAKDAGFDVPLYTATGWGGAVTGGLLPVMGGYCDAPWDQRVTEIEPSGNYIFTYERNDHNIGSDYGLFYGITFDINKFPYLTAELGGGLQVTHHRRPIATSSDIGAMSLVKLGSGVNLLGYYMYHGGTNPMGILSTLQESKETGYLNDLPILSYDFRAPIREYGQISETFKEIKLYSLFLNDFGENLCKMKAYIPSLNPPFPSNNTDLRYSIRHNGKEGYIFINNYQRKRIMKSHKNISIKAVLPDETIEFCNLNVENNDYFFFPFNMKIGENALIKKALATPLCIINKNMYFFYGTHEKFLIEGNLNKEKIILISREDALNAWKVSLDKEYLIISENPVIKNSEEVEVLATKDIFLKVYPKFKNIPNGFELIEKNEDYCVYKKDIPKTCAKAFFKSISPFEYEISFENLNHNVNNLFLQIDYTGDSGKIYIDHKLIADNFYTGEKWEIELKRFNFPNKIRLEIAPLYKDDKIYLENFPKIENEFISKLNSLKLIEEHKVKIKLQN